MSLSRKIALVVCVPVAFQALVLLVLFRLQTQAEGFSPQALEAKESIIAGYELQWRVNDAVADSRDYVATGDARFQQSYRKAAARIPPALANLERLAENLAAAGAPRFHLANLRRSLNSQLDFVKQQQELMASGLHEEALARESSEASTQNAFRAEIAVFLQRAQEWDTAQDAQFQRSVRRVLRFVNAVFYINIVVVALLAAYILRDIIRRLKVLEENTERLAAQKPLNAAVGGSDEIARLEGRFHAMAARVDEAERDLQRERDELRAAQLRLVSQNKVLEQLNQEKNHFLGMAAHDLRNPMQSGLLFSDLLIKRGDLTDKQMRFVLEIRRVITSMAALINDFLDISKIEAGELRLQRAAIDLHPLLARSVEIHRPAAEEKQLRLSLYGDSPAPAFADTPKIEQVVSNLLTNAIKFSPPGGQINVHLTSTGQGTCVIVRDEGQGIPPAELGRLFEPFYKTSVRPTGGESSTGLGLAICRKIVEGHGGKIWAESDFGRGSTFHFTIPRDMPALSR